MTWRAIGSPRNLLRVEQPYGIFQVKRAIRPKVLESPNHNGQAGRASEKCKPLSVLDRKLRDAFTVLA
jgi:hypothetical protein